jgi:tartrate dehydratase beta subunit/fumarate hydratase class I family protein
MPECLWRFRVASLGPLFVAIDTHGNNLHEEILAQARAKVAQLTSTQ